MGPEERLKRKNEFDGNLAVGVRQFNLATGRDAHLKQREQEKQRAQLVDPLTGSLREELSRSRPCPVCGSETEALLFVKDGFHHVKCTTCGMVYVNPVLCEERLHSFYQKEDSYTRVLRNELQISMDRKKSQYGLDLIEAYIPQRGKLLDVGCGPGTFLEVARELGWQVQGVEFNQWCVRRLRSMDIDVIDMPLEQAKLARNSYQCVTIWTVLEHITDPSDFLASICQILAPGGILLVLVPNIDSLANRILHEKSVTFAGDVHINFFNAATLSRLLQQAGLEVNECETLLTELGAIANYLNYEDPHFGESDQPPELLTPAYIHDRMLGYQLLALASARKK